MPYKKPGLQRSIDSIFNGDDNNSSSPLGPCAKLNLKEFVDTSNVSCYLDKIITHKISHNQSLGSTEHAELISKNKQEKIKHILHETGQNKNRPHDEQLKILMSSIACEKGYACCTLEIENPFIFRKILGGKYTKCLDKKRHCSFRSSFLFFDICTCPVQRLFFAKYYKNKLLFPTEKGKKRKRDSISVKQH